MLGVLLESRARRQRRSGGVALSVITHLALIAAATAATARGPKREREKPVAVVIRFTPPPPPQPAPRSTPPARVVSASASMPRLVAPDVRRIQVPTSIPTSLPEVRLDPGGSLDSLVIGSSRSGAGTGRPGRNLLEGETTGGSEWRGSELLMRIISSSKPRYPEVLRQAGVDGRVLVRFVVDTTGRVDPTSVNIITSTHDLFTRSVRESLAAFRFKPAEVNGRRVPALAEMPFEFAISK